jgi:hypothetical protein
MRDPTYLDSLVGRNIGVLLGRPSSGLCTIDIDDDEQVEPFLKLNPGLCATMRTKRVRGCNLWVFLTSPYPKAAKITICGRSFGEWRTDGNQTVIWGEAQAASESEPTRYRFIKETQPIKIDFTQITWPEGCSMSKPAHLERSIRLHTASLHHCISTSLHNNPQQVLQNIVARADAEKALASKRPQLVRLYLEIVEPRFEALPHGRNDFVVRAVPFLYRAVAAPLVLDLVGTFYDAHRSLFNDSRETHMREAESMLCAVESSYTGSLSTSEQQVYEALGGHEREAFRICRDFALLPDPHKPPMTFFLAFGHLADRLGIFGMQAQRIMRRLETFGLLKLLKKGVRRASGVQGLAGTYQWLLK